MFVAFDARNKKTTNEKKRKKYYVETVSNGKCSEKKEFSLQCHSMFRLFFSSYMSLVNVYAYECASSFYLVTGNFKMMYAGSIEEFC